MINHVLTRSLAYLPNLDSHFVCRLAAFFEGDASFILYHRKLSQRDSVVSKMSADPYSQLEHQQYAIALNHDLTIRVIEYEIITRIDISGETRREVKESRPCKVHDFKVQRDVLASSSKYFDKLVSGTSGFKEELEDCYELHEDLAGSVELWLKILHGCDLQSAYDITTIKEVWEMLALAHKYGLDPKMDAAKAWFETWFNTNKVKLDGSFFGYGDYQSLLFPCHTFNYADGFQKATHHLAYCAGGHITEKRPDGFRHDHLRLDANIMRKSRANSHESSSRANLLIYQNNSTLPEAASKQSYIADSMLPSTTSSRKLHAIARPIHSLPTNSRFPRLGPGR